MFSPSPTVTLMCAMVMITYGAVELWSQSTLNTDSQNVFLTLMGQDKACETQQEQQRDWPVFPSNARVAVVSLGAPLARLSPGSSWIATHAAIGLTDAALIAYQTKMNDIYPSKDNVIPPAPTSVVVEFGPYQNDVGLAWVLNPKETTGSVFVANSTQRRWVTTDYIKTITGKHANEYLNWAKTFADTHRYFSVARLYDVLDKPPGASSCHDFAMSSLAFFGADRENNHRETVVFYGKPSDMAMSNTPLVLSVMKARVMLGDCILRMFLPWIAKDFTYARTAVKIIGTLGLALQIPGLPVFVPHAPYIDYCILGKNGNETCAIGG